VQELCSAYFFSFFLPDAYIGVWESVWTFSLKASMLGEITKEDGRVFQTLIVRGKKE